VHQDTSIQEIAGMFDLTPSQIHAALSYYYDHTAEIEAVIAEENHYSKEHQTDTPRLVKKLPAAE
jgi:hypothetical protein